MPSDKVLVRWFRKTGLVELYMVDPIEPAPSGKDMSARRRRRPDVCWHFNKGIAALADTAGVGLAMIEDARESERDAA